MTTSVGIGNVETWAREQDKSLRADDPRLRGWVYVVHDDGTTLLFKWAYAVRYPLDPSFIVIFTEDHRTHVYQLDEATVWGLGELECFRAAPPDDDDPSGP